MQETDHLFQTWLKYISANCRNKAYQKQARQQTAQETEQKKIEIED